MHLNMKITNGWLIIPENDTHYASAFDVNAIQGVCIERSKRNDEDLYTALKLEGTKGSHSVGPADLYPELLQLVLDYHSLPHATSTCEDAMDF